MPSAPQQGRANPLADLGDFTATPRTKPKPRPDAEAVREVSEKLNFPSRQAAPKKEGKAKVEQRRYRTGRNVQMNIKATAETVERFGRIAAEQGWVTGETLERALDALEAKLKS